MNLKHSEAIIAAMPHLKLRATGPDGLDLSGLQHRKLDKPSQMLLADHLKDDLAEKALLDPYYYLDY
jgi:hypothetical protein